MLKKVISIVVAIVKENTESVLIVAITTLIDKTIFGIVTSVEKNSVVRPAISIFLPMSEQTLSSEHYTIQIYEVAQ